MLSDADLDELKAIQEDAMPDPCLVQRKTTTDTNGVRTGTYATIETTVCRIRASGKEPEERLIAERMGSVVAYTISLPAGTDVTEADRLVAQERTFEVGGVLHRSYDTARRVVCKEIGHGGGG